MNEEKGVVNEVWEENDFLRLVFGHCRCNAGFKFVLAHVYCDRSFSEGR